MPTRPGSASRGQGRKTDAILSCPGCFTTCCIDCQQHEYKDQYRAMFVTNCRHVPSYIDLHWTEDNDLLGQRVGLKLLLIAISCCYDWGSSTKTSALLHLDCRID